jgi:ATP-dependent protease Clp ATPase subunit|tara:strand:- start:63 stop:350 length:288 start_codon:yes stop_codon:yes gene_type:complete
MATKTKHKLTTLQVCDACGKNEDEVKKMLLLPNYSLCNECIGLASELVEEDNEEHISTLTWLMRLGIKPKEGIEIIKDLLKIQIAIYRLTVSQKN